VVGSLFCPPPLPWCRAALEEKLHARRREADAKAERRRQLEAALAAAPSDEARTALLKASRELEVSLSRDARKRMTVADFEPLCIIGRGAFGEVTLVRPKGAPGAIYALKTMRKDAMLAKGQAAHVRAERDALARAKSGGHVIRLHASFQDADSLHLLMDYAAGGDLMSLLIKEDRIPEEALRFYAAEAVQAVASIHALGYIHRDLKVRAPPYSHTPCIVT
jgi:serine/threonine kinase 38